MADFKFLQRSRDGAVEHLQLNRPDVRNAFNEELIAELLAWAKDAEADAQLRVVVLSGAGPSFCAGADLAWMSRVARYTRDENIRDARMAAEMFAAIDVLPVPVIARIQGAAIGGGAGLAAVADIAVAEADAAFGFTEVKLGLLPAVIAPYVIAKIGESAARDLFLTGRRFTAAHAKAIGLVHDVAPAAQLDDTVQKHVDEVLGGGREAIAHAKQLIRQIARQHSVDVVQVTAEAIADRRASAEARERIAKFLNKLH